MTTEEILFFAAIILFYALIWLAELLVERFLYVWIMRLRILRMWLIILVLLIVIGLILAPEPTLLLLEFMAKVAVLTLKMAFSAIRVALNAGE